MKFFKSIKKTCFILSSMLILSSFTGCFGNLVNSEEDDKTLFISEYLEGTYFNKAIELYNPTNQTIDLSEYEIIKYINTNENNSVTLELRGQIDANETFVITNYNADNDLKEKGDINNNNTVTTFNGDDMLELSKNGAAIDRIWFTSKTDGANIKAIRKSTVTKGNTSKSTPSDDEWVFSNDISDFSTIGVFSANEAPPTTNVRIHDIQGASHFSPMKNQMVTDIEGIVTAILYKYKKNSSGEYYRVFDGFVIQEKDEFVDDDYKTSEALLILPLKTPSSKYEYAKPSFLDVGDLVKVSGEVIESGYPGELKQTAIKVQYPDNDITEISSNNPLPSPVIIGTNQGERMPSTSVVYDEDESIAFNDDAFDPENDAMDFYESLENMIIQINNPHIVGVKEKYGEIYVLADNGEASSNKLNSFGGIKITENNKNPELLIIGENAYNITEPKGDNTSTGFIDKTFMPKTGDKFDAPIKAIVNYSFGNYKMYNIHELPNIIDGGLTKPVTSIIPDSNKLTIATFNIENFHKGVGVEKIERIASAILYNLKSPDIIALVEVQDNNGAVNDGTTDASESYNVLINKIKEISASDGMEITYEYTDIAPENNKDGGQPGGNIRVGYLYKNNRVTLVGNGANKGLFNDKGIYQNGHLNKNPVRIDPQNPSFENTRKSLAAEFYFNGHQVIVINNHFSSKSGSVGLFTVYSDEERKIKDKTPKRINQAQVIHDFAQSIISSNSEAIVVVIGDMNDYEYSDPINTLKGNNLLYNLYDKLPENERFSYIYTGNSQVLDNVLINSSMENNTVIDPVNINSMFVDEAGRCSDHDPVLIQISY